MALTYLVLSGVPGFMRRVENAWVITPIDANSCRITSTASFTLAWYIMPLYLPMYFQLKGGLVAFQVLLTTYTSI
ncbi:hypothetical protein B484DRAFT_161465 [Ochromonadaceae sp. CCMP2298]|nr:hypothetical protein B484DRAFT_161465 [Ochromonadaceae sp. CCMP2298]